MPAISTGLAIGLGALSAGTSIAGGLIGRSSANRQAEAAERASAEAVAEQRRQFDISRQDLMPWIQTGGQAVRMLGHLLGLPGGSLASGTTPSGGGRVPGFDPSSFDPDRFSRDPRGGPLRFASDGTGLTPRTIGLPATEVAGPAGNGFDPATFGSLDRDFTLADFEADPGYAFRLAEGQKAIERSAAARGGLFSGRQLKDIERFGQDFASNEFGRAFNRFESNRANRFNRFASLAGLGQTTATQLAGIGGDTSRSIGDIIIGGATSAAASRASGANALAQGISGGIGSGLNFYLLSQILGNR